ncbi:hypothetical protein QNI16_24980 [Cytophagaceae bacterium YF14B1]|uniref:Uncharacterized protein n=1 Tax=Xanthocytophaga flava TaxID=3048013 RepID=A0AAE3QUT6_9BACT|nr:hypothetical protein [Xanthocytophaga flavus]MDJ1483778.1 hypothetical protein [Xanthocytophaga flavus]
MSFKMGYTDFHSIEEYDRKLNIFYFSLNPLKKSKGLMGGKKEEEYDRSSLSNIAVYEINTGKTRYLFDTVHEEEEITHFLFESSYVEEGKRIEFNHSSSKIQNNSSIAQRDALDRLLICQSNKTKEINKLWSFRKNGEGKRLITEFGKDTEWRIDVFNQKIRVIKRHPTTVEIQDFEW